MAADKVQVIQDWPEPRKIKDIQSFLGFTNFYRCFILHYSDIAIPLTCLTRKGSAWDFSDKCCSAFNMLKKAFTTTPVLTHWIPGSPLIIETDVSDYTLTTILSTVPQWTMKSTPLLSTPTPLHPPNSTMMSTTRNCSPFSKLLRYGATTSRDLNSN